MPEPWFRFPVWRDTFANEDTYEWYIPVQFRTSSETFDSHGFLIDTASQLTTIPIAMAERHNIPLNREWPVTIRGSTGTTVQGFVAPLWFSLPSLRYQFMSRCCFTPVPLRRPLLSLTDVLSHFRMRTLLPSRRHPLGSLLLQVHRRHKGQPRPD